MQTSDMQTFDSDGVPIAYIDEPGSSSGPAPEGDPILLIHGFASNHAVNWANTGWVRTLNAAGRRIVALDNRGHGRSAKLYDPALYDSRIMAEDARRLLDHLGIARAHVMGYSMGARITAFLAMAHPERVRTAILGGLGWHLVDGEGLPLGVAEALEAPSLAAVTTTVGKGFRMFAEQTRSDLRALAACMRGSRQVVPPAACAQLTMPVLVAVGTADTIAGSPHELAALLPDGRALDIPGRDHNLAVGDKVHKQGVLAFLAERS